MPLHNTSALRVRREPWLPLPETGGATTCPLWDDLKALEALRRS